MVPARRVQISKAGFWDIVKNKISVVWKWTSTVVTGEVQVKLKEIVTLKTLVPS